MDVLMNVSIPLWALLAYLVFMCAVQALPRPVEGQAAAWYVWFYSFSHLLCMNLTLVIDPLKKLRGPER